MAIKERKDSLECRLNRALFVAELEFLKILLTRLPQNTLNVNIKCVGKQKKLYSLCEQPVEAVMFFYCSAITLRFELIMPGGNCAIYACCLSMPIQQVM